MTEPGSDLSSVLVAAAIAGRSPTEILEAISRAMVEAGIPLLRTTVGALLLHPLLDATLVIWRPDRGAYLDDTPRPAVRGTEAWRDSPFHRLEQAEGRMRRYRLAEDEGTGEFPVLAQLVAEGASDYLVLRTRLAPGLALGDGTSVFSSWACDRPGGFTDAEIARISAIEPLLAVVVAGALGNATAATLLATYLGSDAARRVLGGDVERGRAEMIHAVIWYSDLAGFTRIADQIAGAGMLQLFAGAAEILRLLNDHAEILVDAIEGRGGQVLKFMGDGILAIFRGPGESAACEAALEAWAEASARCGRLGRRPIGQTHPYLALHAGDVLYGNIGGRARLDFTVLGPAVNEASRIAAMCRQLDRTLVMSEEFAGLCPSERREQLLALGSFTLRGVARPQMLYGLAEPAG
ncbi:MAG: adenylate/guanylate cyclase domain-containing protein [Geminicoccaceae bacterium]